MPKKIRANDESPDPRGQKSPAEGRDRSHDPKKGHGPRKEGEGEQPLSESPESMNQNEGSKTAGFPSGNTP
jgi:hypothetical protein